MPREPINILKSVVPADSTIENALNQLKKITDNYVLDNGSYTSQIERANKVTGVRYNVMTHMDKYYSSGILPGICTTKQILTNFVVNNDIELEPIFVVNA